MLRRYLIQISLICFLVQPAGSQQDSSLQQTQELLKDPSKREQALQTPDAKNADAAAGALAGSAANKEKMYQISSDLMTYLNKESGGDPSKMMEILAEAQKNPEAFYKKWPPAQRAALEQLVKDMSKSGNGPANKNP